MERSHPRIVFLTTDTPHHRYMAKRLSEKVGLAAIVLETDGVRPPFDASHPYEKLRDEHERRFLLEGRPCALEEYAPVISFDQLNREPALDYFRKNKFDLSLVAGARRLSAEALSAIARVNLNCHGGDPEEYRGLDSHFWAIYHGDFSGIVTALHLMNPILDDGELVAVERVPLHKGMRIEELRGVNTRVATDLLVTAAKEFIATGSIRSRPQNKAGRYYSFMPTVLKDLCVRRFHAYTEKLER